MAKQIDIAALYEELKLSEERSRSLKSQIKQLEEAQNLDTCLSSEEEEEFRRELLEIGKFICGPNATFGHLSIIQEEVPGKKYEIRMDTLDIIQYLKKDQASLMFKFKIFTKSAHIINIIRETFIQEKYVLGAEDKNKAFRTVWKTNWHNDTGQHIRHVDLDFTEEYKKI
jgi:hypothetical protein